MKLSACFVLLFVISCMYGEKKCAQKDSTMSHQDFGSPFMFQDYLRPWRNLESFVRDCGLTIKDDKDKFQIILDVQLFDSKHFIINFTDGYIVIKIRHVDEEDPHSYVSVVRKYSLPEGTKSADVVSELNGDGMLTITAPRKKVDAKGKRFMPKTGPVKKEPKENAKQCSEEEKCKLQSKNLNQLPPKGWGADGQGGGEGMEMKMMGA